MGCVTDDPLDWSGSANLSRQSKWNPEAVRSVPSRSLRASCNPKTRDPLGGGMGDIMGHELGVHGRRTTSTFQVRHFTMGEQAQQVYAKEEHYMLWPVSKTDHNVTQQGLLHST